MKRGTKALSALLAAALVFGFAPPARAAGEVTGYALYTDIVAQVDGHSIPSYNVGGRTAVLVKDLAQYGLYVYWNEDARTAYVWPGAVAPGGQQEIRTDYEPAAPEGKVGDPAYPIYASDTKVVVAGEEKESFNIGGHTLVYLSDLEAFGTLTWNNESRLAGLTLEDPVELALERKETELKEAGLSYTFTRYPGPKGTLAVYSQGGTPHGSSCMMLYVHETGKQTQLDELFPVCGFGAQYYLTPRDIQFDSAGESLTFLTPVKEEVNGETVEWGDTRCTFNTLNGTMTSMVPVGKPLEQWELTAYIPDTATQSQDGSLYVAVIKGEGEAAASFSEASVPYEKIRLQVSQSGVTVVHESGGIEPEGAGETAYDRAEQALMALGLPRITQDGFQKVNTQEQKEAAGHWFQVTKNGQPVTGVLWWGQGNGHVDLNFDFDGVQTLTDGDLLEIRMGELDD